MSFNQGHALLIGVSQHQHHADKNVPMAGNDVAALQPVLQDPHYCGYPAGQVKLIAGADCSQANILAALDELAQIPPDQTIFLFFVGHGMDGTDGQYHLATYDVHLQESRVVAGTGLSAAVLLQKLRAVQAKRLIMFFNSCQSGHIGPGSFAAGAESPAVLGGKHPTGKTAHALLGTGEGRILIVASRADQLSYFQPSIPPSFFTRALIDALKGQAASHNSYITAFGLYEYLYAAVKEMAADTYGVMQEALLTAIQAAGSFPVALYNGATAGAFAPLPDDAGLLAGTGAELIKPETAAQALARSINTGGGAYVAGDVNTGGGAFIGRDQNIGGDFIMGDKVAGDKVGGDQYNIGDISHSSNVAIGRGARAVGDRGVYVGGDVDGNIVTGDQNQINSSPQPQNDVAAAFTQLEASLAAAQLGDHQARLAATTLTQLRVEAAKGNAAQEEEVYGLLDVLAQLAPTVADEAVTTFLRPVRGLSPAFARAAARIQAA